jgi:hypothetical protein
MVVDEARGVLLGVTFVGPDVSELLQAATVPVVAAVPLERLWHAVPAYPTVNEIWLRLLETYGRPMLGRRLAPRAGVSRPVDLTPWLSRPAAAVPPASFR